MKNRPGCPNDEDGKKCASELISNKVPQKIAFLDKVSFAATGKKVK